MLVSDRSHLPSASVSDYPKTIYLMQLHPEVLCGFLIIKLSGKSLENWLIKVNIIFKGM